MTCLDALETHINEERPDGINHGNGDTDAMEMGIRQVEMIVLGEMIMGMFSIVRMGTDMKILRKRFR